jgi:hypothetical protein
MWQYSATTSNDLASAMRFAPSVPDFSETVGGV